MYQIDFKKPMHIHFIGIGGISMSISKYPAPMPTNPSSQSSWKPKEPFSTTVSVLPTWMTHRIWWSTQPPSTRTIRNMPLR